MVGSSTILNQKAYQISKSSKTTPIGTNSISKFDEESQSKTIKLKQSFQQTQFGDNYGRSKRFSRPEEDEEEKASLKQSLASNLVSLSTSSGFGYVPIGLRNIGNTCYMNSILQCLFASAPLTEYFETTFKSQRKILKSNKIAYAYYELLEEARSNANGCVTPSELKGQISKVAKQFYGYGQQDAQEFLRFLLDGMHNELNRVTSKPKYQEIDCESESMEVQSDVWFDYFKKRDNSIITDLFEG